ncbi:MAG: isoprenylcysteine carboxylmethyltransferase family protein [Pirellulales bacterium]|nr:isoprenylcysteine carboxylmethyltransferase family protein [Pirellulales bacterium]
MDRQVVITPERASASRKAVIRVSAAWIALPLFFLATGGAWSWWQAWTYCALLLVPMTCFVIWMARRDPAFFERRFKMQEKERTQRRIQAWGAPFFLSVFIIPGLDHRFSWSALPLPVVVAALVLSLGGYLIILRVFLANRWAGRTVETWGEQQIISTGPYAIVRHPMYTGTLLLLVATPIALGSWWGVAAALACIPIFVLRIVHEEKVLIRELHGYDEYRRRVRYRLVPIVW